jgi:hypothetical protein
MAWVTSQYVWVLVFGCLAIALGIALVSRLVTLRVMSPTERDDAHTIAAALMTAFAAAFVLLTALTLANEVNSLSSDQTIVSNEAADAAIVAWSATNPGVNTVVMQRSLYGYLVATRTHEWNGAPAANGDDPATGNAIADMERTVRGQAAGPRISSTTSNELLTSVDALTTQRRLRLAAASHSIPAFYVVLVVFTGLALIVNTSVVSTRGGQRTALLTTSLTVVALSVALLFALATPWRGAIQVSGHPIETVIKDLQTGSFTR